MSRSIDNYPTDGGTMLKAVKDWGAIVTVVLAAVAGLLWIGELRSDVKHLTSDVVTLKKDMAELKKPVSAKGDMCRTMTERISDALDEGRTSEGERLADQMTKLGCYGLAVELNESGAENATE